MNCSSQREQLIWKVEVALELIKKPPAVDDPAEEPYIILTSLYQLRSGFDKTIEMLEEVLTRVKPVAN
jgi:hypothetical protein